MIRILNFFVIVGFLALLISPTAVFAQGFDREPFFALYPAKNELNLSPGAESSLVITVANQMGTSTLFSVSVVDLVMEGSAWDNLKLTESGKPLSLANFVTFDQDTFLIPAEEERTLKIRVALSENIPPGSIEGAIVVKASSPGITETQTVAQIASLVFITVPGEINESGQTILFDVIGQRVNHISRPVRFQVLFSNEGNNYLNPYGLVVIKNIFGQEVEIIPIDPWFVLPDSLRTRELSASLSGYGGLYKAELVLNRGYENILDEEGLWFFVWSWPLLLAFLIFLTFGLGLVLKYLYKK